MFPFRKAGKLHGGAAWVSCLLMAACGPARAKDAPGLFTGFSPPEVKFRQTVPSGSATGFVHVEQVDGTWWLVDADGRCFWSVGVCASGGTYEEPYLTQYLKDRFAGVGPGRAAEIYARETYERLLSWRFNSFGCWSREEYREINAQRAKTGAPVLYLFDIVNASRVWDWAPHLDKDEYFLTRPSGKRTGWREHTFIDPWNEAWREAFRRHVRRTTQKWLGRKDFAGYFVDNECGLQEIYHAFFSPACGRMFVRFLRERYGDDITALAASWGRGELPESFDDVIQKHIGLDLARDTAAKRKDYVDFMELTLHEYARFVCQVIRAHDPDHLVIGMRFGSRGGKRLFEQAPAYQDIYWKVVAAFSPFDVFCQNLYPMQSRDHYSKENLEYLSLVHQHTGRPILIGEFGVTARDSGIDSGRNAWDDREVDTQVQRGLAYRCMVHQAASLPFVVGAHWFKWSNGYGMTFRGIDNRRVRNCGLVDGRNLPYDDFVRIVTRTNETISRIAR